MRLMIVDDDADLRQTYIDILENDDCQIITAFDGESALRTLKYLNADTLPDCMILDLVMPERDGSEVLELLRANDTDARIKKIPIIIASSLEIDPQLFSGSKDVYFLQKPFTEEKLIESVDKALS